MRRLLPWVLLGLLGVGVVVGAVVGALGSSSGPSSTAAGSSTAPASTSASVWVADLLATTADAGTAHLDYSHVTTSTSPLLDDTITGTGVVDFTSGDVAVTEVDRQPSITQASSRTGTPLLEQVTGQEIGIGRAMYQAIGQEGTPDAVWMKLVAQRDPHAELGLQTAMNSSIALDALGVSQHVVAITDRGPATVNGVATTRYSVTTAPLCAAQPASAAYETTEPVTVWVNGAGRLVQVRTVVHESGKVIAGVLKRIPALAHIAPGTSTTTDTLHFSAFGQPVDITAPHLVVSVQSTTGSFRVRCNK